MPKDFHDEFLTFSLDMHHRITIRGAELRFVWKTDKVVTFHAAEDPRRTVAYEVAELNRMNRAGEITVVPYALMPERLRPAPVRDDEDVFIAGLSPAQRGRVAWRYAMVRGFLDLKDGGLVKGTDASIVANMDAIRDAAEDYFQDGMGDPEYDLKLREWKAGRGPKPRTPKETPRPGPCSPRALRSWLSLYRKGGKVALIDQCAKQGNVNSPFTAEEVTLLAEVVRDEYTAQQRKTQAAVVKDVKIRFAAENERREAEGLPKLKVPGRDAVRGFIQRLDCFRVLIQRRGEEHAMKNMRAVKDGVQVSRPFERVEMDEHKIDLITILAQSGLLALFSEAELEMLGLNDPKKRWWLVLAIDCRTRCILGMVLTCDPRSSAALKCLRMVVSDKGQFADNVGALAPWSIFGTPEMLVTDNGAAFKSALFTSACTDLGIHAMQAIGGMPAMRGIGERVFGTISTDLMSRLSGRTFSNVLQRENYGSEKRACLTVEDLCVALVRWAVDIYHNTPHAGLGGRTPLQQWEADLRDGNTPLHAAPNVRRRHIALGVAIARVLQKDGLRVMHIRYHSRELAEFYLSKGRQILEIRWNEEDLGTIEVKFDGAWRTVPAVRDTFKGVHASIWLRAMRSLKMVDPKRREWEEDVVFKAIRDIEAMNAQAKLAFKMIDQAWTEERLKAAEDEARKSFDTVPTRAKTADTPDGRGQTILPIAPVDHAPAKPEVDPDRHRRPKAQAQDSAATDGKSDHDAVDRPSKGSSNSGIKPGRVDGWDIPE